MRLSLNKNNAQETDEREVEYRCYSEKASLSGVCEFDLCAMACGPLVPRGAE
jgi:hypothetical protein